MPSWVAVQVTALARLLQHQKSPAHAPVAEGHAEREPRDRHRQVARPLLPLLLLWLRQLPRRWPPAGAVGARLGAAPGTAGEVAGARLLLPAAGLPRGAARAVPYADRRSALPVGDAVKIAVKRSICRRCRRTARVGQRERSVLINLGLRLSPLLLLLLLLAVLRSGRIDAASAYGGAQQHGGDPVATLRAGQLETDALAARLVDVRRHHPHKLDVRVGTVQRLRGRRCRRRCEPMPGHSGCLRRWAPPPGLSTRIRSLDSICWPQGVTCQRNEDGSGSFRLSRPSPCVQYCRSISSMSSYTQEACRGSAYDSK